MNPPKHYSAPKLPRKLLRLFLSDEINQEVEGDLEELYQDRLGEMSMRKAKFRYWKDVFASLRNSDLRRSSKLKKYSNSMINHYFKVSARNLRRNKGYTFLNIFGLLLGLVSAIVILQYVFFERSFDGFHANSDRIYRLRLDFVNDAETTSYATTFSPTGALLEEDFPEVEESGKISYAYGGNIYESTSDQGDIRRFKEEGVYHADQGFWNMFSFKLIHGNKPSVLSLPQSIMISESTAKRYFGNDNALGKIITRNGQERYSVSGVFEDVPANSHVNFDMLLSVVNEVIDEYTWRSYDTHTYVRLTSKDKASVLEEPLKSFLSKYRQSTTSRAEISLQPLESLHFDRSALEDSTIKSDESSVNFLYYMAIAILIVAWINFVNLSSSAALTRGKEVSIRKVLGSAKGQLTIQYIVESLVINLIAVGLSIFLAAFAATAVKGNFGIQLMDIGAFNPVWTHLLFFLIVGGVTAGLYPAILLSSFKAAHILRGRGNANVQGASVRKILVIIQFMASVLLITITLLVKSQVEFMQNADLGINTSQTIVLETPSLRDSTIYDKLELLKSEWKEISGIEMVAFGQDVPGGAIRFSFGGVRQLTETVGNQYRVNAIEPDYAEFYGLEFVAGRNVSREIASDMGKVYINEAALALLGFSMPEEALNKELHFPRENVFIVGVVRDFHIASVKEAVDPAIFHYRPVHWPFGLDKASIRIQSGDVAVVLGEIQQIYEENFPGDVFEYFFLDRHFDEQYKSDSTFGRLFGLFAFLAVIIANLGLFGLTAFTFQKRLREITIRKVLGAGIWQLVSIFSVSFLKLIAWAMIFGAFFSYLFAREWFNNFEQHIVLEWWMIVLPMSLTILITQLVICVQTGIATSFNPVKYLRRE